MNGIVSLLDEKHYRLVEDLWAELELALLVQEKQHRHWSVAAAKATLARL